MIKNRLEVLPVKTYKFLLQDKVRILKDNKDKTGVYRWINKITNKSYVGASFNLSYRLKNYYSTKYMQNKLLAGNSLIYYAFLNYEYSDFYLEILEYCDKQDIVNKEQYYIDLFKPEYNILKYARSSLGFKHSAATKNLMRMAKLGKTNSLGYSLKIENKYTRDIIVYSSIKQAAKSLGYHPSTLGQALRTHQFFETTKHLITRN